MSKNRPVSNRVYTTLEVYELDLPDSPNLLFYVKDGSYDKSVVQTSHITDEELLANADFGNLRWYYLRTTSEWIPVFLLCSPTTELDKVVRVEPSLSPYDEGWLFAYPEYAHRAQYPSVAGNGEEKVLVAAVNRKTSDEVQRAVDRDFTYEVTFRKVIDNDSTQGVRIFFRDEATMRAFVDERTLPSGDVFAEESITQVCSRRIGMTYDKKLG
jgi:hypothetical protein